MTGIGGGLLQRCCFFGQHSHTLHSLLGLTDVKLKNELSALVDTSIWVNTLQDVKGREKKEKHRVTELSVEIRVREEEAARSKAAIDADKSALNTLENEVEEAKLKVYAEMGRSSDMMNSKFSGESLKDVTLRLNQTIDEISNMKSSEIEPLKKSLLDLARSRGSKTGSLERNITITTERLKSAKTTINASQDSIRNISLRVSSITQQLFRVSANYTVAVNSAFQGLPVDNNDEGPDRPNGSYTQADLTHTPAIDSEASTAASPAYQSTEQSSSSPLPMAIGELKLALFTSDFQRRYDACLTDLAGVTVRLDAAKKSMKNLDEGVDVEALGGTTDLISMSFNAVKGLFKPSNVTSNDSNNSSSSSSSKESSVPCSVHNTEECPTCGQALSPDALGKRITEVASSIISLQQELRTTQDRCNDAKKRLENSIRAEALRSESSNYVGRYADCMIQIGKNEALIADIASNEKIYQSEIIDWENEKMKIEEGDNSMERQMNGSIDLAEKKLQTLNLLEQKLRTDIDEFRSMESTALSSQSKINATLALLEDRVTSAQGSISYKTVNLQNLKDILSSAAEERELLIENSVVFERLSEIFGPRGIQHYVFMSVIKMLEDIANSYLNVLAEGGIQLALEGDELDKIDKSVMVRSADGSFRERGLSQLSGGQWRRVSMALDFAFAEIIRRKGSLRSNLIVMDEVLTHLDSSGREAVGSVLRAMVDNTRSLNSKPSGPGGMLGATGGDASLEGGGDELMIDEERVGGIGAEKALRSKAEALAISRALIGGGSYETVLVILQDLAATELEEAFDHIDVVVKESDTAKVLIDGI